MPSCSGPTPNDSDTRMVRGTVRHLPMQEKQLRYTDIDIDRLPLLNEAADTV